MMSFRLCQGSIACPLHQFRSSPKISQRGPQKGNQWTEKPRRTSWPSTVDSAGACNCHIFSASADVAELKALIFDCDGVILESEDLHRLAYNATFEHFRVKTDSAEGVASWSTEFYDRLQNSIGGGKPKMRWFFGEYGWPTSSILPQAPTDVDEQVALIDTLQDWKTIKYQEMIASGEVAARPGVLKLFDEARRNGLKIGVCSAATKSSAVCVLENLLGMERFKGLDVFMAGDDVEEKKPDPSIYQIAAERLGVLPAECLVIEDSTIGLQAALGAGMRCIITYTSSTESQPFEGAERVMGSLDSAQPAVTIELLRKNAFGAERKS